MTWSIRQGDVLDRLREMPDESVQCCVTSPPYWQLRDYGVDGQIGLEASPDEHIAKLVEVFREVRRVLRADGVLWLNYGDAYAASTRGAGGSGKQDSNRGSQLADRSWSIPPGLKSKDLIGLPWRLARALQEPYYTGKIRDERDRVWLAAMLDAEGCLFIHRRKAGQSNGQGYERKTDSFGPGVEIANTSLAVIERIMQIVGKGSICSQGPEENGRRKQRIYRWNLRTTECREFVRELYPHLVAKRQQARILIGCPSSGDRAAAAHAALISLHRTGSSDVDFPDPASLFEPGWYLRSDVIWSKGNPMPESVTDRPTKAHEYLFLLSKSARYFYDAEAIREPDSGQDHPRRVLDGQPSLAPPGQYPNRGIRTTHGRNGGGRNARTVWTINPQPTPEAHFATFPEALVDRCVKAGSRPGDTVLDPFAGSGTTLLVAERLGRDSLGIELNPEYIAIAERRIKAHDPTATIELAPGVKQASLFTGDMP